MSAHRIHVQRTGATHPPGTPLGTPCRLWQGRCDRNGYAMRPTDQPMHRWVLRQAGVDQSGVVWDETLHAIHLCDNPACYRYDHLRLGTHDDNMADMKSKGRRKRPVNHGTEAGYQQHRRHGDEPCPDCRAAKAEHSRRRRRAVKLRVAK